MFFVIQLNGRKTPETSDPDGLMSCDIMDGRDAFLTLAREKHYEFSSLRRAVFSTMAMLVELHNQGQDRFVYTCNICRRPVETRYHCNECDVSRVQSNNESKQGLSLPLDDKHHLVYFYFNSWQLMIKIKKKKKRNNNNKIKKKKNEKPLELRKRARDPIQGTTPSILST